MFKNFRVTFSEIIIFLMISFGKKGPIWNISNKIFCVQNVESLVIS